MHGRWPSAQHWHGAKHGWLHTCQSSPSPVTRRNSAPPKPSCSLARELKEGTTCVVYEAMQPKCADGGVVGHASTANGAACVCSLLATAATPSVQPATSARHCQHTALLPPGEDCAALLQGYYHLGRLLQTNVCTAGDNRVLRRPDCQGGTREMRCGSRNNSTTTPAHKL